ncbi:MAG: hypothetical protein M1438_10180 [Deltaproteobacteria bacterium]|nr:hypothetical protein [Deltaproteobacteria bacterium]
MKNRQCLMAGLALALAAILLLAGAALAQSQGGGPAVCPMDQGNQLCTGGPGGTCAVNPAQNPGKQNCSVTGAAKAQNRQGMKGPQGGAQSGQPATPANPPATSE